MELSKAGEVEGSARALGGHLADRDRSCARLDYQWARQAAIEESSDNAPFTPEQQAEIAARIDDVEQLVAEKFELEARQLEGVLHGLDEIKAASKRVGLKDLRVIVYGYAFGWIANDAIHPSTVQTVVGMIFHAVGHALGIPTQPPALPAQVDLVRVDGRA